MTIFEVAVIAAWMHLAFLTLAIVGLAKKLNVVSPPVAAGAAERLLTSVPANILDGEEDMTLLVFASSSCLACQDRIQELGRLSTANGMIGDTPWLVVLSPADVNEVLGVPAGVIRTAPRDLSSLGIPALPFGALVDRSGAVAHSAPLGSESALLGLLDLVDSATPSAGPDLDEHLSQERSA